MVDVAVQAGENPASRRTCHDDGAGLWKEALKFAQEGLVSCCLAADVLGTIQRSEFLLRERVWRFELCKHILNVSNGRPAWSRTDG